MAKVVSIIMGVLLAVGGFYCMLTPIETYSALTWLIGLAMIFEGVAGIIVWNELRSEGLASGWTLAGSIISIVLGVILLGSYVMQFALEVFIAYFIAIWLVVAGVVRIVNAISSHNSQSQTAGNNWGIKLAFGVLLVILGVLYVFNPVALMAGIGMMLGVSIAIVGIDLIVAGITS